MRICGIVRQETATRRFHPALPWLLCAVLACMTDGMAAAVDRSFSGLDHKAWSLHDGAPADIWAIAQSGDGYLWLGTGFGLYRFDGMRFESFVPADGGSLLSQNITALSVLRSGDIWVGYYHGGLTRIREGRMTHFSVGSEMPSGMVYRIAEGPAGDLWIAHGGGLLQFRNGRWHDAATDMGCPRGAAHWVMHDANGTLWAIVGNGVFTRAAGEKHFAETGIGVASQAILAEAPDGTIWVSDEEHGTRPLRYGIDGRIHDDVDAFPALAGIQAVRLVFADDGSLWGSRRGHGVFRVALPGSDARLGGATASTSIQYFARGNGLTADTAVPLFRDREGNLWVGTVLGLNQFRYRNVVALPRAVDTVEGYDQVIHADDGSVLVASSEGTMTGVDRSAMQRLLDGGSQQAEIARTRASAWWLRRGTQLHRYVDGVATQVTLPAGTEGQHIVAMTVDARRRPWLSMHDRGVFVLDDDGWQSRREVPLPVPTAITQGIDGRMWFGYQNGDVATLDDSNKLGVFGAAQGLSTGPVTTILAGRRHVIVAGEHGIARFDGDHFRTLGTDDPFRGISGIVETTDDQLWLNGSRGVVRVDGTALVEALRLSAPLAGYALLDQSDGLPGVASQTQPIPTAVAADGLLWLATNAGVAMIDPQRIRINPLPPEVHVLSLTTPDSTYQVASTHVLPARTSNLQIAYTATSLSAPERVRFRYRLDPVDGGWRDSGNRRDAFYTNLGPGDYRFHVIAANNDGIWNDEGATVVFRILPTFFQSPWFALACVLLAVAASYVAYLLHLRQLAIRMRTRLEERHLERERIARELHDTLLQSFQGLLLRFHAMVGRLGRDEPLRRDMNAAIDRAEAVLAEGRDRVRGLRSTARDGDDLSRALDAIGTEFASDPARLHVADRGSSRRLRPLVRDELYQIAREAIVNAFRHADAGAIDVSLHHDVDAMRLSIRDDGVGIDADILERGDRPGHWGLAGMRERTRRINGRFDIRSQRGAGTMVTIAVPASVAYGRGALRGWQRIARVVRGHEQ